MIYLQLFWEFFKTGLFAVGGGMATLPFLQNIGETTGWYTYTDLMNMLAVSESTPGPVGINMATYVGFVMGGIPGAVVATLGEIAPSIIIILIIAAMLRRFQDSKYVAGALYGLRPASTGLIAAACAGVMLEVLTTIRTVTGEGSLVTGFVWDGGWSSLFRWKGLVLAVLLLVLTHKVKAVEKLHPIVLILASAVVGVIFQF